MPTAICRDPNRRRTIPTRDDVTHAEEMLEFIECNEHTQQFKQVGDCARSNASPKCTPKGLDLRM